MTEPIALGIPKVKEAPFPRRKTRLIHVGDLPVGGGSPITVQSMTTTKTHDIGATLQQIAELTAAGCDIVRVACPTDKDAEALPIIARQSTIPVIADIHFQPKYVFAAIDAGCAAVRVNPGNIRKFDDQVGAITKAAAENNVSLRIGVNAGSLDRRMYEKYGRATPEALAESAIWEASLFEEHGFHDFKISVKHHDPVTMIRAYEFFGCRRLAAAPRRDRSGTRVPGNNQVCNRIWCAASRGDWGHHQGLSVRAARGGSEGGPTDPPVDGTS